MAIDLTAEQVHFFIRVAEQLMWEEPATRRTIQECGINIIPADFYSGVPTVKEVQESFEYRNQGEAVYDGGLFDRQAMASLLEELAVYAAEFAPPPEGDGAQPKGFFWKNPAFSHCDAMLYYCMIRHFKPRQILEIGSGFSTLVADAAIRANGFGAQILIEPYPKPFLRGITSVAELRETPVQQILQGELLALVEASDLWFIDSTHTVKSGSDCLYLYLKIMPEIRKDILIHSHDIYLPFALPQQQILKRHLYWTEQYLLYAWLLDNPRVQVLAGTAYARAFLPEHCSNLMAGKHPPGGASFWYRVAPALR